MSATKDNEFTLLGEAWSDDDELSADEQELNIGRLAEYKYFDGKAIRESIGLSKSSIDSGKLIYDDGKVRFSAIRSGYNAVGEVTGQVDAVGVYKGMEFPMTIAFSREKYEYIQCLCPDCRYKYWWYTEHPRCRYVAALSLMLEGYLEENHISDATDRNGRDLLSAYRRARRGSAASEKDEAEKGTLALKPRIIRKSDKLSVAFKVGAEKMFVVKNLGDFCSDVRGGKRVQFGSSTELDLTRSNFTEESKKWISFIERIVREENQFSVKLEESGYSLPKKFSVGGSLDLFGWRLDGFYDRLGTSAVDYEDKTDKKKKKATLTCATENPDINITVLPDRDKKREFHGVIVEGTMPQMFYGMEDAYFIHDDKFCRVAADCRDKIAPLSDMAYKEHFTFKVGRKQMGNFFYDVLPQLGEVAKVDEKEPVTYRHFLPPKVHFSFYLDAVGENVVCGAYAQYGKNKYSVGEYVFSRYHDSSFRNFEEEKDVTDKVMEWLPCYEIEEDLFHCEDDEDTIYRLMNEGVDVLLGMGEVHCTDAFRSRHIIRRVKVSVGVSIKSGLLDLEISTGDLGKDELLGILNSYRAKKKYHRLKNGEFVDIQEPSVEMLSELAYSLHITPKELAKGKLHIPEYRTLYLDSLLEEHDEVYSHRDRHFKDMVKDFKTISDADFEEPKSLSGTMRKYQKKGFRWLRTLETWKFGGILADDMGLGKTLQMIAVMLSAKEEGKSGTSLVVCPAALVYNWGEEFAKFAPALSVNLIVGNQEERSEKIANYADYDVIVTSYDLLKRDADKYENAEFLYEVIDEAQYIKNHTTAAAKSVKVIKSQVRFALSGTPIENRLSELWSIFDYLMPGFLYNYETFRREFETPIVKNNDEAAMARLKKMTAPFILRRLKEDVLKDLPEKLEEIRYVRFDDTQQKLYDAQVVHMKQTLAAQGDDDFNRNKLRILAELTKLRQICCSPSLCFDNYHGESAKADSCMQLIESAIDGGHRMLVFSQFTSMLEIIAGRLDELNIPYYTITGETKKKDRLDLVKSFNEGSVPVFLISLKAGGVGLNLTGADVVIHYDPWWNVAAQNQATDRAHRIGQTKKVTVYKLIAKGTLEEKIQKLQDAKRDLAEQVIGGETGYLAEMNKEELLELLG